ncbi:MAG TPA: hypothetical protein V6D07_17040 [Trichocoleus sp.]
MALAQEGQEFESSRPQVQHSQVEFPERPHWLRYLVSPQTRQPTLLGHAAIAGSFFASVALLTIVLFSYGVQKEKAWLNFDGYTKNTQEVNALVKEVEANPAEKARMRDQFLQVQRRIRIHAEVMSLFYRLNFISLSTITLSMGVASISLFFISKLGWERVNNAVISLFILTSGLVLFHSNLILIFKYQKNIELNQNLFADYSNLRNAILSYWATQQSVTDSPSAAKFIYQIDDTLVELGMVTLDFDTDKASQLQRSTEYSPTPQNDQQKGAAK